MPRWFSHRFPRSSRASKSHPTALFAGAAMVFVVSGAPALAHDIITTKITWNREIIRIIQDRCASCHHPGGSAFSLMTYNEGRPWAKAIQEETLERRMPPWGAVKGFGDFRNDRALTPEQIELIADWVEGGAPEGEDKDLPGPPKPEKGPPKTDRKNAPPPEYRHVSVGANFKIHKPLTLAGLLPKEVAPQESFKVTLELPDGSIHPLLWLQPYKPFYAHPFLLRTPLAAPAGSVIRGIPPDATIDLLAVP